MGFLTKTIVAKKAGSTKTGGTPRKAVDMSLIKSTQAGAARELFSISRDYFKSLGLNDLSVSFTDIPLTLVVVSEDSPLALAMHAKRKDSGEKSHSFSAPDFETVLETNGLIPTERVEGFKAIFKLTKQEVDSEIYNQVIEQAGENSNDVRAVCLIDLVEITSFTPAPRGPRKPKVEAETADPAQTDMFTPTETITPVDNSEPTANTEPENATVVTTPVAEPVEYTGEESDDVDVD